MKKENLNYRKQEKQEHLDIYKLQPADLHLFILD